MTISNQCRWFLCVVLSITVMLLLLVQYFLNRTTSNCPQSALLMEDTGECYTKNTRGPCTNNLLWLEDEPESPFGGCSCPNTYLNENRTMLFHSETMTCYYIFDQAFCEEGEWVTISATTNQPICERNTCLDYYTEEERNNLRNGENGTEPPPSTRIGVEWVPIKGGRCAQLGKTMEGCENGTVVRFHQDIILASCHDEPRTQLGQSLSAIGVPKYHRRCPLGSYRSIAGKCQPTFDFDFN